jgi:hypothetical protein
LSNNRIKNIEDDVNDVSANKYNIRNLRQVNYSDLAQPPTARDLPRSHGLSVCRPPRGIARGLCNGLRLLVVWDDDV